MKESQDRISADEKTLKGEIGKATKEIQRAVRMCNKLSVTGVIPAITSRHVKSPNFNEETQVSNYTRKAEAKCSSWTNEVTLSYFRP